MVDAGTAYGRPTGTHNARLTEVGPGTAMGEDLILCRDGTGRPGLVDPRCGHRGSSLLFGRIENEGIRCCDHGWMFDVAGRCLERPADFEAQGSRGPISLHSEEYLATSDKAIVVLRRLFETQIQAVEAGRDPIGVHFEPGSDYVALEGGAFISAAVAEDVA